MFHVQETFSGSMPPACLGLSPGATAFLQPEANSCSQRNNGMEFPGSLGLSSVLQPW